MAHPTNDRRAIDLATRFQTWLDDPGSGGPVIHELLNVEDDRFTSLFGHLGQRRLRAAVGTLLDRSHRMLSTTPRESVVLSRLAIRLCEFFSATEHRIAVAGDAWREQAIALLSAGDYSEADAACVRADCLYTLAEPGSRAYERALLTLTHGQVAHFVGDSQRALELIETAVTTLAARFPEKRSEYVRARTIHATMLVVTHQYEAGLRALEECAELAREYDASTLAFLLNNIGNAHLNLGHLAEAKECFRTALEGFVELGLTAEMPRVHSGLALALMQEGRTNEAISELYKARATFLELGMPVKAAETNMYIIGALFAAERRNDIRPLCAEAIETFSKADLPREAAKALGYINASAVRNKLTADDVEDVREFLCRLQTEADLTLEEALADEGGAN